jgi:hypothetical protein
MCLSKQGKNISNTNVDMHCVLAFKTLCMDSILLFPMTSVSFNELWGNITTCNIFLYYLESVFKNEMYVEVGIWLFFQLFPFVISWELFSKKIEASFYAW